MPLWNIPYTFSNGTTADANQVDQNFTSLQTLINGGQDDSNMKVGGLSKAIASEGVAPSQSIGLPYAIDVFGSTGFVSSGCTVTKDGTNANQVNVSAGVAYVPQSSGSANGQLRRITPAAYSAKTTAPNSTYYLDLNPDGSYTWGGHSSQSGYVTIATVTSDGSSNVATITDTRPNASNAASATPNMPVMRNTDGSASVYQHPNMIFNPSWHLGAFGWNGIGSNGFSVSTGANGEGAMLINGTSTTSQVQVDNRNNKIPASANTQYTLSGEMLATGVTAGGLIIQWFAYDSNGNSISGGTLYATNGQGWTRYKLTFTTPANTATLQIACVIVANTTFTGNVGFRKLKLEGGAIATTYSDDSTLDTAQNSALLPFPVLDSSGNTSIKGKISKSGTSGSWTNIATTPGYAAANWSDYGNGWAPGSYRINALGKMELRGLTVTNASTAAQATVATLGAGLRPGYAQPFTVPMWTGSAWSGTVTVTVDTSGIIRCQQALSANQGFDMSEITYEQVN